MTTLVSTHHEAALLEAVAARHSAASRSGIRDLLRDTALLVTTLSRGGQPEDATALRERCQQLMATFAAALERRGYATDVREDAEYAQCGLLDEAALRHLSAESKPLWDAQPLQVQRFGKHDAGEKVFDRLSERMREASPNLDLLEAYSAVLGMGFMGRYGREGDAKLTALIASLNAQLEKLRPVAQSAFIAGRTGKRLSDWLYRLSPWAIAGLACVVAAVVWLISAQVLDAQLANLAPKAIRP